MSESSARNNHSLPFEIEQEEEGGRKHASNILLDSSSESEVPLDSETPFSVLEPSSTLLTSSTSSSGTAISPERFSLSTQLPRKRCFIGVVFLQFSRVKYLVFSYLLPSSSTLRSVFLVPCLSGIGSAITGFLLNLAKNKHQA